MLPPHRRLRFAFVGLSVSGITQKVLLNGRGDWQQRWDFRGDPDHDADPRIFKGILPLRDRNSCTNFAGHSKKLLTNCESF